MQVHEGKIQIKTVFGNVSSYQCLFLVGKNIHPRGNVCCGVKVFFFHQNNILK